MGQVMEKVPAESLGVKYGLQLAPTWAVTVRLGLSNSSIMGGRGRLVIQESRAETRSPLLWL